MDTVWILGNIDEHVDLALRGGMEPGSAEGLELATRIMSLAIQEGEVLSHAVDHPRTIPQAQDLARSALRMMGQDPSVSCSRPLHPRSARRLSTDLEGAHRSRSRGRGPVGWSLPGHDGSR